MAPHASLHWGLALLLTFAAASLAKELGDASQLAPVLDSKGCIKPGTFNPRTNYFSSAFFNQAFARPGRNSYRFSVRYYRYFKVVKDLFANKVYVLFMCGGPRPALGPKTHYFSVPLQKYAVADDVTANYLQLLGQQGRLGAAPPGSMVDPCMQKLVKSLPASLPSAAVFSAYLDPTAYQGANISFSATFESNPLRRAEWIKYVSLFFNRETLANQVYYKMYKSYACNLAKAKAAGGAKPRVGWISFYGGVWTLSSAAYKLKYVSDAGGTNPPQTASGGAMYNMSLPGQVAAFFALLKNLDVAIDESYLPTGPAAYTVAQFQGKAKLSRSQAATIPFIRSNNLWTIYGQYTSDLTGWFEGAVAQPQVVLQELVAILHPKVYPSIVHTFLANVARKTAVAVTAANCKASNIYATVPPSPAGCAI